MTGFLQTAAGLGAVVALILACAWMARGSQRFGTRGHAVLRVVAAQALSARERVVVVEIGEHWLVLGVAPGHVSRLGRMTKPAQQAADTATTTTNGGAPQIGFSAWLERALQRK